MTVLAVVLALNAASASDALAQSSVANGEAIVERDCGGCHALGRRARSPLRKAPPLRTLSSRYDINDLGEALAEGLFTGHPVMPVVSYEPEEIDAVLSYLKSIQPAVRNKERKR